MDERAFSLVMMGACSGILSLIVTVATVRGLRRIWRWRRFYQKHGRGGQP